MKRLFVVASAVLLLSRAASAATCSADLFLEAASYPAGPSPGPIVIGFFNGDAFPDLAVADSQNSTVSILLGNGDGTFGPPITSPTYAGASALAAGDFDGDGTLDLALGGYSDISILIGNGDGTFQPPVTYNVGGGSVISIAAGKLDAGDTLDLAVSTQYGSTPISILLGNGDGTFGAASSFSATGQTGRIALGDFDGDGALDIVASQPYGNSVSLLLGHGDGTFGSPASFVAGTGPDQLATGDFNGDGNLDVAVHAGSYVSVLMGNGAGSFGAALQYPAGPNPGGLVAADLDGDGFLDLAIQSNGGYYSGGGSVSLLRGDGSGAFQLTNVYLAGSSGGGIAAADLNGDGATDLAVSNQAQDAVSVLMSNGTGGFEAARTMPVPDGVGTTAWGFFNDDPFLDLATTNGGKLSVLLGDGLGGFVPAGTYDLGVPTFAVIARDFTNDFIEDLVVSTGYAYPGLWFLRGVGDGTFVPAPTGIVVDTPTGNLVSDFYDGVGSLDLAVTHGCCGSGGIDILLGNGDGTFVLARNIDLGATPYGIVSGLLHPGATADLAVTEPDLGRIVVLLGNGDATFQPPVSYPVQPGVQWLTLGSLDPPGDNDLVAVSPQSQNISTLKSNGDGTFTPGPVIGVGQPAVFLGFGDFNQDGIPDLYTANGVGNSVSVFLGLGGGTFASPTTHTTGSNATFAVTGDFDQNQQEDLVVSASGDIALTILLSSRLGVSQGGGSGEVCLGGSTTLTTRASGFGPIAYQWLKDSTPLADGGNISGAQTPRLTISPVGPDDHGDYSIVATDLCTSVQSLVTTVSVFNPPPVPVIGIDVPPAPGFEGNASTAIGGSAYAWEATGAAITGGQGTAAISFVTLLPGTVTLKVTEYSVPGCGTASDSVVVPVDYYDVPPSNIFHDDVVTIGQARVTVGCGNGDYCPTANVTRAQMAVFLLKSLYGADYVPPVSAQLFGDVPPGSFAYDWINALASLGVTSGCGGGNYCPGASTSRAQMAVFLLKTLLGSGYAPPPAVGIFGDVPPGSFAADYIEDVYNRGIAGGCSASPLLYCPDNPVNRGQMAAFLVNTFF